MRDVWKLKVIGQCVIPVAVDPVRFRLHVTHGAEHLCRLQEDVLEL